MPAKNLVFDAEEIAAGIAAWAAIESPSVDRDGVNRMMDAAARLMAEMGADLTRHPGQDGFADVLQADFRFGHPAAEPGILVLGHLDTVHLIGTLDDELPITRDGDFLYGPGVLDMKGGMYLACHAVQKLLERDGALTLPVRFLFIPDEEVGSPSTRAIIEDNARWSRFVLVPEPGKEDRFVTGRHAFLRYKIHVFGKPAHAGVATGVGRSAISVMAKLINEIEAFSEVEREVTYRVGNVAGGTFVNVVPTECHAEVLCVAPTPEDFDAIQARMASIESPDEDVRVEIEAGPVRPLFRAHEGTMELLEVAQRIARDLGLELGHGQLGGGSDGNFTGALGVPTLDGLGVVGSGVHTKAERLIVSELPRRAQLFAGLVTALCEGNR